MLYEPRSRYELRTGVDFSAYSRPRRVHEDGTYEIHLVKAADPHYIPPDMDIWPLYYQAIAGVLRHYPDALEAATEAYVQLRKEGKQRRD